MFLTGQLIWKKKWLFLGSITLVLTVLLGGGGLFNPLKMIGNPLPELPRKLPELNVHPLPDSLVNWKEVKPQGDYFDQITPPDFGHLIWSRFPLKVFIKPSPHINQQKNWEESVLQVVKDWGEYLPIIVTDQEEQADIKFVHQAPPFKLGERVRSAETRYELYVAQEGEQKILAHRFTIYLSPTQTGKYAVSALRHEMGHGLGIWGHSPVNTDVMFFSQVRNPSLISQRDINTLKRIYEQPTRLGWEVL